MLSNVRKHELTVPCTDCAKDGANSLPCPRHLPSKKKPRRYDESDDQKRVVQWIRERPNWLVMRMENALRRTHAQAARDKALGMEPGAPDLIVMFHTFSFYLEMKSVTGSVSPEQRKLHEQLRARGMPVAIGYGASATIAALLKLETMWNYWREQPAQRIAAVHQLTDREHQ